VADKRLLENCDTQPAKRTSSCIGTARNEAVDTNGLLPSTHVRPLGRRYWVALAKEEAVDAKADITAIGGKWLLAKRIATPAVSCGHSRPRAVQACNSIVKDGIHSLQDLLTGGRRTGFGQKQHAVHQTDFVVRRQPAKRLCPALWSSRMLDYDAGCLGRQTLDY